MHTHQFLEPWLPDKCTPVFGEAETAPDLCCRCIQTAQTPPEPLAQEAPRTWTVEELQAHLAAAAEDLQEEVSRQQQQQCQVQQHEEHGGVQGGQQQIDSGGLPMALPAEYLNAPVCPSLSMELFYRCKGLANVRGCPHMAVCERVYMSMASRACMCASEHGCTSGWVCMCVCTDVRLCVVGVVCIQVCFCPKLAGTHCHKLAGTHCHKLAGAHCHKLACRHTLLQVSLQAHTVTS